MTGYRDVHVGEGAGERYDAMHVGRVDSMIWKHFVRPYVRASLQREYHTGSRRYLDFACGTGRLLKVGASIFSDATGIDISEDMLQVARERVPTATIHHIDVTKNPNFRCDEFDCATLFRFVLNAEPELSEEVLSWIAAHMKPGGLLIVNNHRHTASLGGLIARSRKPNDRLELNVLSRAKTVSMLESAGFKVEQCKGFRILPSIHGRPILGGWIQLQTERVLQALGLGHFGTELVFTARRTRR